MTTILEKPGFVRAKKLKIVGTSPVKHDGIDKVTGRAKFSADMFFPAMRWGGLLGRRHPRAIVRRTDPPAAGPRRGVRRGGARGDFPGPRPGTPGGPVP